MKKEILWKHFETKIVKRSKDRQVIVNSVNERVLWLTIDEIDVRITKPEGKTILVQCSCDYCSKKGIATNTLCQRQIKAIQFLSDRSGLVSEIEEVKSHGRIKKRMDQ